MRHTARLQRSADLDRTRVRALCQLLRLLSSRLHTRSQARLMPTHCAAVAGQSHVQQHVHVRFAAVTCIQRAWRRCTVYACRKHATTIVQAALRRHTVLRQLLELQHARALDAAAARVQRFRRRYTAQARRTAAATAVQAFWRGRTVRNELLCPPGTRPFDTAHNAAAGMRVCLSPDGRRVPTGYDWDYEDSLTPSIDGTVVRIEHHVDGVAVYVRSDDASRHVRPYAVEHLLRLVPPAYDDWGALLGFARRHAAYCSVRAHACSRTLRQAWLVWHTFSRTAQQLHTLYVHAACHSHRKQLRRALHSWHRHHRRRVHAAEALLAVDTRRLHGALVAWSRHVISCHTHQLTEVISASLSRARSLPDPWLLRQDRLILV